MQRATMTELSGASSPRDRGEPKGGAAPAAPPGVGTSRRAFLRVTSVVSAVASAIAVGVPVMRSFLSPVFRRPAPRGWTKVGMADQIDVGTPVKVDFTETINDAWIEARVVRSVWLFSDDGETFTAFSGSCPHLGCAFALDPGGKTFTCPCHRGVFDSRTGEVLAGPPPRSLDPLPVRVANGEVQVMLKQFRSGIPDRVEV